MVFRVSIFVAISAGVFLSLKIVILIMFVGLASVMDLGPWVMFRIELVAPQIMDRYFLVFWEGLCYVLGLEL